jgi:hypothetical protein
MGNFACSVPLSLNQIIAVTESTITNPATAITELNLIAQALGSITPSPNINLDDAINNALIAAQGQAITLFNETFPVQTANSCFGVVINYVPQKNDYGSITNQIFTCLADWNLQNPSLADLVGQPIQDAVFSSAGVPISTFGSVPVPPPAKILLDESLFWTVAFGVFSTGETGEGSKSVIFGFAAANGQLEGASK